MKLLVTDQMFFREIMCNVKVYIETLSLMENIMTVSETRVIFISIRIPSIILGTRIWKCIIRYTLSGSKTHFATQIMILRKWR
jgi:hypothetical protein